MTNPGKQLARQIARMKRTEENILNKKAKQKPPEPCKCRNHKGGKKARYATRELAVNMVLKYHLKHGDSYNIYECPESEYFHVATKKKAK